MYTPDAFVIHDRAVMHDIIARHPLAALVTNGAEGPVATQLPLMIVAGEGGEECIIGHFARANDHWKQAEGATALAIFRGADGYVTPDWYATKRATGKVVPTWNYVTVQARGPLDIIRDPDEAMTIVGQLTDRMENTRAVPWGMRGLVTFRMEISALHGQAKLSQNKDAADRDGVRGGLNEGAEGGDMLDAMARWT